MRYYKQLTQEQRYAIKVMNQAGHNQKMIATFIKVHPATISRELRRNCGDRGYRHKQAHQFALERRRDKSKVSIDSDAWSFIESLIQEEWSPEQISGWVSENMSYSVSHEHIYQHILSDKKRGGTLYQYLRCKKQRKKRYGSHERRGQLVDRVSIEQRPDIVEKRSRLGDWELDTIVGKNHKQAIVTLTERRSGLALIKRVERSTAKQVSKAIVGLLKPHEKWVHTMTADNGKEFAEHKTMANKLDADFYFAHPYSPWERGCNENMNGLIRQYFPKGMDFTSISESDEMFVMNRLNNRPRKRLGFRTPNDVFFGKQEIALTG
jgi:transposase, IS30 family